MHEMNFHTLDLNLLRIFKALWECRGLTKAGEMLGLSQPAVSHALNRLRTHAGDRLFVREGSIMRPTPKATEWSGPVKEAIDLLQSAMTSDNDFSPHKSTRIFRVTMSPASETYFLPKIIQEIERNEFTIRISSCALNLHSVYTDMTTRKLDCCIGYMPNIVESLVSDLLVRDKMILMLRKDHPLTAKKNLSDIINLLSYVGPDARTPGTGHFANFFANEGITPRISLTVSNFMTAPEVVKASNLGTVFPDTMFHVFNFHNEFRGYSLGDRVPAIDVRSFWRGDDHHDAGLKWFRKFISDIFVKDQ